MDPTATAFAVKEMIEENGRCFEVDREVGYIAEISCSRDVEQMFLVGFAALLGAIWWFGYGPGARRQRAERDRHESFRREISKETAAESHQAVAPGPGNTFAAKQKRDKEAVEIVERVLDSASASRLEETPLSWDDRAAIWDDSARDLVAWLRERDIPLRTVEWAEALLQPPIMGPHGEFRSRTITDDQARGARMIVMKARMHLSE